jgi:hypothetical protein
MIGRQVSSMLFPEWKRDPGFDVVNNLIDASSEVYLRSSLSPIPDAVKPRLLTTPFSTTAFARSTVWRFEASSCKAASKDLPSSHVQHGASAPSWHNTFVRLSDTHPPGLIRPELRLQRSPPRILDAAAWSGLESAPESRSRGADPHLPRSFTTPLAGRFQPFLSLCSTLSIPIRIICSMDGLLCLRSTTTQSGTIDAVGGRPHQQS